MRDCVGTDELLCAVEGRGVTSCAVAVERRPLRDFFGKFSIPRNVPKWIARLKANVRVRSSLPLDLVLHLT